MESYLGSGTVSQRTGRDLPNPAKSLIVRVRSHYRESSGGSCSEQDREGEKHIKYSNTVQVYCDYFYKIAVVYNTFLEI